MNQLTPARGRKLLISFEFLIFKNQLTPARGRKLLYSEFLKIAYWNQLTPARGRKHPILKNFEIPEESTHPRKGTETVWLRRMDISRRKSQLTPARGRKLAYIFTTICYFTKESTHPREGTETPLSALLFHASIGINSPPQGDEQYIIKDSDAH